LEDTILTHFREADVDENGMLDLNEFKAVLRHADFKLDNDTIEEVLKSADKNSDGTLDYEEFLPVMQHVITKSDPSPYIIPPHISLFVMIQFS